MLTRDEAIRERKRVSNEVGFDVAFIGNFEFEGETHHVFVPRSQWYALSEELGKDFWDYCQGVVRNEARKAQKRA